MRPSFEVATIINDSWAELNACRFNAWQLRTLDAIGRCRSASMGGHIDGCDSCGYIRVSYNSCRNRHCPKCQGNEKEKWIAARETELLPVKYFHIVFTLPDTINRLCLYAPQKVYTLLFNTAWQVMQGFSKDEKFLGAQSGMIAILHTWGQNLSLHPHLHCIAPAGGITKTKHWKHSHYVEKKNKPFLFPAKAMSSMYRARYVAGLRKGFPNESRTFFQSLFKNKWVVYTKQPFGGPLEIIKYLGRYTHKIAISNHRIISMDDNTVTFGYKDYKDGAKKKQMTLSRQEFIRRFAQHILPKGFTRIRHYGILANSNKKNTLEVVYGKATQPTKQQRNGVNNTTVTLLYKCPCCKTGNMQILLPFDKRGPPLHYLIRIKNQSGSFIEQKLLP